MVILQAVVSAVPAATSGAGAAVVVEGGNLAGQVLLWVAATFGTSIGSLLTMLLVKMMQKANLQVSQFLRDRLKEIVINGLNAGAQMAAKDLKNKGEVEIKNATLAYAVKYTQDHAADTLKKLGADPSSAKAIDAINGQIATAIADPTAPTPAVLDQQAPQGIAAVPVRP